jgi:hypothetical protein
VGDGTGEIVRETVAAGSRLDCFAFNQFIGGGDAALRLEVGHRHPALRHRAVRALPARDRWLVRRSGRRQRRAAAWEGRTAREDAARAVTIVGGVAGPRVRSVAVAGHVLALSRRRAFLHVVRGVRETRDVPVEVTYRDGSRRRFGA